MSTSTPTTKRRRPKRAAPTPAEREARAVEQRERLASAIDELRTSEGWMRWLRVRRAFHSYSLSNQLLIAFQRPGASRVMGYRQWQKLGYQVRGGERGIRIIAPRTISREDEETGQKKRVMVGGLEVSVFDISQCDAGPDAEPIVPPGSAPIVGDTHRLLLDPLVAFADSIGFTVTITDLSDRPEGGWCDPGAKEIVIDGSGSPNEQVATLVHEAAHACGIGYEEFGRCDAEVIVESATFCALDTLGLDTSPRSVAYVAGWGEGSDLEALRAHAQLIDAVATRIATACEGVVA